MRVVIAGGGTGGHVIPGIAIAKSLLEINPRSRILFVGTRAGLESKLVPEHGFSISFLPAKPLKGRNIIGRIKFFAILPLSLLQAIRILQSSKPRVVVGVGGYVSLTTCLAARLMGIPVILQEQNSFPGRTNQLLSKFAKRIYIAFDNARTRLPNGKCRTVGTPVRAELAVSTMRLATH